MAEQMSLLAEAGTVIGPIGGPIVVADLRLASRLLARLATRKISGSTAAGGWWNGASMFLAPAGLLAVQVQLLAAS